MEKGSYNSRPLPVKEMDSQALHRGGTVATQGASFDKVVLTNVFVLEVRPHGYLALESSVAYRAMVRQAFSVCREVFSEMILSEEPFLADAALVRLHAGVPHLMAPHVRAI